MKGKPQENHPQKSSPRFSALECNKIFQLACPYCTRSFLQWRYTRCSSSRIIKGKINNRVGLRKGGIISPEASPREVHPSTVFVVSEDDHVFFITGGTGTHRSVEYQ
jgi:hypothetical protein